MLRGIFIKESFKDEDCPEYLLAAGYVTSTATEDVSNAVEGQPDVWTLNTFEIPEGKGDFIANEISENLNEGKWYVDFKSEQEVYVVFAGKIFHYQKDDAPAKKEAVEYARSLGIPESQLDW